ncbi:MAG TPA: glycosyltransferase [Bdellovibrionales bacterium]|nr:glycosyltransferase [Bdellovibrionales bacterium]
MTKVPYIFYGKQQNWESHNITFPSLIRTLEGLHCRLIEFWPGEKLASRQIDELSRRASHLIMLPHMYQSLELLGTLRRTSATQAIPAVIVSASQSTSSGLGLLFHRKTIRQSDVFVVPSTAERASLGGLLTGRNRVFQCPYPILPGELRVTAEARAACRERLGFEARDKIVTYVGRLTPQKNILELVETLHLARRRDKRLKLLLVGAIADEYSPVAGLVRGESYARALKSRIKNLGLAAHVSFTGHVSHAEALQCLASSDAAISLSTYAYDDYGRAVAEGLSMGIPTVATAWGGSLDFVRLGGAIGIEVRVRDGRPVVSAREAAAALEQALSGGWAPRADLHKSYFGPAAVRKKWRRILSAASRQATSAGENLRVSNDTNMVMLNRISRAFKAAAGVSKFAEGPLYESRHDLAYQKHLAIYSGRLTERSREN